MVPFTFVSLAVLVSTAAAQVSTTDVAWTDRMLVCMEGAGPMNVTSSNWAEAQKLFGNSSKPAWIASYNGDTYEGSCLSFSGNSVNVPASCTSPTLPVLCHSIAAATSSATVTSTDASSTASAAATSSA